MIKSKINADRLFENFTFIRLPTIFFIFLFTKIMTLGKYTQKVTLCSTFDITIHVRRVKMTYLCLSYMSMSNNVIFSKLDHKLTVS